MQTQVKTFDSILIALLNPPYSYCGQREKLEKKLAAALNVQNVLFLSEHYHMGNGITLSAHPPAEGVLLVWSGMMTLWLL